jgi:hypothetical protein
MGPTQIKLKPEERCFYFYNYPEGGFFAQLATGNFICILISKKLAKLSHRPRPDVDLLILLKNVTRAIYKIE